MDIAGRSLVPNRIRSGRMSLKVAKPLRSVVVWLLYSAVLVGAALHDGLNTQITVAGALVTPLDTNTTMIERFGQADAGSYARGAREIVEYGWFKEPSYQVLWPPGFFVLQAMLLSWLGDAGPILLALIVVSAGIWALVLTALYCLAREAFSSAISFLIPLSFLAFPFFRQYLIRDGVVFNESLSTALWLFASLMVFNSAKKRGWLKPVLAGALFAAAAYIRAQIDLVMLAMTGLLVVLAMLYVFADRYAIKNSRSRYPGLKRELHALVIAILVFHALTIPYRAFKLAAHRSLMFSTANYYWQYQWMERNEFTPVQGFILKGGAAAACHVEPELCAKFRQERTTLGNQPPPYKQYQRAATAAFLRHPWEWIVYRVNHLPPYWFSRPSAAMPSGQDRLTGFLLAGLTAAAILFAVGWARRRSGFTFLVAAASVFLGNAAVLVFVHYEVRYLYHAQACAIAFSIVALICLYGLRKAKQGAVVAAEH